MYSVDTKFYGHMPSGRKQIHDDDTQL